MSRSLMTICAGAVLISTAAVAGSAGVAVNDAGPIAAAQVSMAAAVSAAETHAHGKAVRAEYEQQKGGGWVYDVEVKAGARVFDVKVDAGKGTVIASTEDTADSDDDGDKAD